jgi:hypothetical protein
MVSFREKTFLFGAAFASLPIVAVLMFSVLLTYSRFVTKIGDDINLVRLMTGEPAGERFGVFGFDENNAPESADEVWQIAGFSPIQALPYLPDSIFQVEKQFAGRPSPGFPPQNFFSLGLCVAAGVLAFFFLRKKQAWGFRAGDLAQAPWLLLYPKNRNSVSVSTMNVKEVQIEESRTLASVNSDGSTFSVFWRRCRDTRSAEFKGSGAARETEYTDPFVLFFKTNSSASIDMVRIIGRLEKENGYLDRLKTYAFRTTLLLRDLGFQLPSAERIGADPLAETILDYYAITVHGIKEESKSVTALETAGKAEELEAAARKGDLVFLTENTPVFLEYMEYFITGIVKLTEEKNIFNDRRLHAKRKVSDLPRRFGKQRRKKSD